LPSQNAEGQCENGSLSKKGGQFAPDQGHKFAQYIASGRIVQPV